MNDLIVKLAKELFNWLTFVTKQSEKYCDKLKYMNFEYFIQSTSAFEEPLLANFINVATQQVSDARSKYIQWMVQYEFPQLSQLAIRMDGVSVNSKVNEEELSLYIRRKDVLNVIKELELKTLETSVVTLRKRLDKHMKSDFDVVRSVGVWSTIVHLELL